MNPLTIRPADRNDVETLLNLINRLAEYERMRHQVRATAALLERFGFSSNPYFHALIAEDEQPLGFALYFFTFSTFLARPTLYLEDLFVLPERRSRGVGTALFRRLASIARAHDCGRMEWAVLNWNKSARRFYQGLGAAVLADWQIHRLEAAAIDALAQQDAQGDSVSC